MMKKAWKGILGLLMAMTFTVSAGRMVYAETVDENHEVPDGVTGQWYGTWRPDGEGGRR